MGFLQDFRNGVKNYLHTPQNMGAKILNGVLAFLVIISIAIIPLYYVSDVDRNLLLTFERCVVTVFTVEYLLRIWSAENSFRYIFSWMGIIDLVAILPFYLGTLVVVPHSELFLALRVLRIFKLGKIYKLERDAYIENSHHQHGRFFAMENEKIVQVVQKDWIVFLGTLLVCICIVSVALFFLLVVVFMNFWTGILLGTLFLVMASFLFLKLWLDFNYDLIYITNFRVIWQQRELFGAKVNEINYNAITNVKPDDSGFLHWVFNYGDLSIETAAQNGTLVFRHADNPQKAVKVISENKSRFWRHQVPLHPHKG